MFAVGMVFAVGVVVFAVGVVVFVVRFGVVGVLCGSDKIGAFSPTPYSHSCPLSVIYPFTNSLLEKRYRTNAFRGSECVYAHGFIT